MLEVKAVKNQVKKISEDAGVYIFWNKKTPIYIGKAINLRRRLASYYSSRLAEKTSQMVSSATHISVIPVPSDIEALLLEAELVWKYQPHFNSALKDDKHPLYIMITKDTYPRVIAAKRADLKIPHRKVFGPFPSSGNLKYILKLLRPIFPYATHSLGKKPCIYSQIGLCVPCPNEIESFTGSLKAIMKKEYLKNIRNITGVLTGRIKKVKNQLESEMALYAKKQLFEEAEKAKKKITRLDYITTPYSPVDRFVENPNLLEDIRQAELDELSTLLQKFLEINSIKRIECFDVAHLAGTSPTASMVTFFDGAADKSFYRHFRIRRAKGGDDVAALDEVAKRRERRFNDWGRPDLIIVDGGKTQTKVFWEVFKKHKIPVVGLAKRFETIVIPQGETPAYVLVRPHGESLMLVKRIRDEAHRFARRYHHKLVGRHLLQGN
ncbi:GIY-YIG nuclease family protein [Candidatus Woesebacteria bacterium]|nr:GIY-YIG nuclease family protein [Candidatus Woesebacteria bacterium]